jgi:hypothetical protein
MIKTYHKSKGERLYFVLCDSTGITHTWQCENRGPDGVDRHEAQWRAGAGGWRKFGRKWFCPDCQRDGFAPKTESHEAPACT